MITHYSNSNYSFFGSCPAIYTTNYLNNGITFVQTSFTHEKEDVSTSNLSLSFKESISIAKQVAFDYLHSEKIIFSKERKFHFNLPGYNTIKEGDSASCSIFISLLSLVFRKTVKEKTVVVGSLDICGNILEVEDIEEKIKTAIEYGFETVIIPNVSIIDDKYLEKTIKIKTAKELVNIVFSEK